MPDSPFYGLDSRHAGSLSTFGRIGGKLAKAGKKAKKTGGWAMSGADFRNQAKMMKYQSELSDWEKNREVARGEFVKEREPEHITRHMEAARGAYTVTDDDGNPIGIMGGSYETKEGHRVTLGGFKYGKPAAAGEAAAGVAGGTTPGVVGPAAGTHRRGPQWMGMPTYTRSAMGPATRRGEAGGKFESNPDYMRRKAWNTQYEAENATNQAADDAAHHSYLGKLAEDAASDAGKVAEVGEQLPLF